MYLASTEETFERLELRAFEVPMSPTDEARLIALLRRRDERAFNEVVRLYETRVFSLVYRMLGNRQEAEDVAQDVFITVFKAIDQFRGESKFSTWLYRIATNHCKNRRKLLARRMEHARESLDETAVRSHAEALSKASSASLGRPDEILEGFEAERLVQEAVAALDEEQRTLLVLRDIEGLSYQEIVDITGLPEGTVKSRLHRARLAIQEHLRKATSDPGRRSGGGKL